MESSYAFALFLHLLAVFALVGGIAVMGFAEQKLAMAESLDEFRGWVMLDKRIGPFQGISALVILLSGMYMAHAHWGDRSPWVMAALVGLIAFGLTGPLVVGRGIVGALRLAEAAGSVTAEARHRLHAPGLRWIVVARPPFLVWFAYLMAAKPGPTGVLWSTIGVVALTVVIGVARGNGAAPAPRS
ncbi:MAG: hypothetical protein ACREL2_10940 [Gemmatimonadales bacterium]